MELKTDFNSKKFQRRQIKPIDWNIGKIPPQARELETAILGAILIEKRAYDIAADILKPESFYVDAHQRIFKAMQFLDSNQQPIDYLTVIEALKVSEDLDNVGGPFFITKLTQDIVSAANIEIHCRIVLEKFIMREMIRLSGETIVAAFEDATDFHDLMEQHEKTLALITTGNIKSNFTDTITAGSEEINRLYYLKENPTNLTGIDTGYSILNHLTGGWQDTDLIIIAGRPSVGKTALALNFLRNAAISVPVGIFSLEMGKNQLMRRMLCAESRVYLDKLNNGKMTTDELNAVVMANDRLNKMKVFIDDTGGMDIYELRSKARRMVSKHGVGLIIIDYLQLMSGTGKGGNREQEISNISRNLKALAKELEVPIIALSQLSRAVETRSTKDKTPQLSDLRESGAIEQDADMVMFIYRPEYYEINSNEHGESTAGETHIKIAKHRAGTCETIKLTAKLQFQKFYEFDDSAPVYNGNAGGRFFIQQGKQQNFDDGFGDDKPF